MVGFRVGIARGVAIRPSTRGIGVDVGPRGPAGPDGDGRVVHPSAFGPLTVYRPTRRKLAEIVVEGEHGFEGELRRLRREDEAASIARHEDELVHAHLRDPPSTRPAPAPVEPDATPREDRRRARRRAWPLRWRDRGLARRRAKARAKVDARTADAREAAQRRARQAELDAAREALAGNRPQSVLRTLEAAFAHTGVPAAAIDCDQDRVTVLVLAPAPEDIADRAPDRTPTGRPKLERRRTQAERDRLYATAVASRVLAGARIAFATTPGVRRAALVALRLAPQRTADVLFLGTLGRERLDEVHWAAIDPVELLATAADAPLASDGDGALRPLDLAGEPELAAVVADVQAALIG
jgi:hypothetical protein